MNDVKKFHRYLTTFMNCIASNGWMMVDDERIWKKEGGRYRF